MVRLYRLGSKTIIKIEKPANVSAADGTKSAIQLAARRQPANKTELDLEAKKRLDFCILLGSIAVTLPFIALGTGIWFYRSKYTSFLGETVFWLVLCLVAGAVGALLSVIARSGKLDFDSSAGRWLHYLEAASRIVMGALSGTAIGLAVKSKFFLEPLTHDAQNKYAIIILAHDLVYLSSRPAPR